VVNVIGKINTRLNTQGIKNNATMRKTLWQEASKDELLMNDIAEIDLLLNMSILKSIPDYIILVHLRLNNLKITFRR